MEMFSSTGLKRAHDGSSNSERQDFRIKKPKLAGGEGRANDDGHFEKLQQARHSLPIFHVRKQLLKRILAAQTVIVIGETGSGKTTQIPQYLYESNLHKNQTVAVTQPRRVAAVSIAGRVADERGTQLGDLVGYSVRFDDTTSSDTKIKYMTDGMLLREAIVDPLLKRYSIVVLDEAHERTVHTDVLFGVVKAAQRDRRSRGLLPLKIIVMSATMDVDNFSKYFNQCPVIYLEGRQYDVKVLYTKKEQEDYLFASLVTLFKIHKEAPPRHDILMFLTGQDEIDSAVRSIRDLVNDLPSSCPKLIICPLYAALPQAAQLKVFLPTPRNARKVIVSTNIAETSITINGIKFVIDAGMVKTKLFNASSGLDILKVLRISQAQAWQRTGRAGRASEGTCYRLYTEPQYEAMRINTVPEIQRCGLSSVVLQMLAMGIKDIINFDFMDKPSKENLEKAIEELQLLGACEVSEDGIPKLCPLGKQMAAYPVSPQLSKTIISAKDHHCLEEILTVVSLLSVDSIVFTPHNKRDEALAARQKFHSPEGDHITNLSIYRMFKKNQNNKPWLHENYLNARHLRNAVDIRKQLREICVKQALPLESCGQDTSAIRRCMANGFFMNAAERHGEAKYMTLSSRKVVEIHPSSSLFRTRPSYVLYTELVETTKIYMRDVCIVDAEWLYEVAPDYFRKKRPLT